MTVWIHVDTSKQVDDEDHLKISANEDAARAWFAENDPEGVAFECQVVAQSKRPGLSVVSQNLNEKLDVSKIVWIGTTQFIVGRDQYGLVPCPLHPEEFAIRTGQNLCRASYG